MKCLSLIALTLLVGCETTTVVTKEPTQPKPAPMPMPTVAEPGKETEEKRILIKRVHMERTGGFAGFVLKIDITPAGAFQCSEGRGSSMNTVYGNLNPQSMKEVAAAFEGFEKYKSEYLARDGTADDFKYVLTYGDKTVTASDASPDVPESFMKLCELIRAKATP